MYSVSDGYNEPPAYAGVVEYGGGAWPCGYAMPCDAAWVWAACAYSTTFPMCCELKSNDKTNSGLNCGQHKSKKITIWSTITCINSDISSPSTFINELCEIFLTIFANKTVRYLLSLNTEVGYTVMATAFHKQWQHQNFWKLLKIQKYMY